MNARVVRNTLVRWFRTPAAAAAMAGVISLALLFGATLVGGFWDPDERTDQIPVALVNEDAPADQADGQSTGEQIVQSVLASPTLDWVEVPMDQAEQGLQDGKYHGILRLPAQLSANIASLDSATPVPATVEFITSDATNYLAGTIAAQAIAEVDAAWNKDITLNFLNEVYDALPQSREQGALAVAGADLLASEVTAATTAAAEAAAGADQLVTATAALATAASQAAGTSSTVSTEATAASKSVQQAASGAASIATAITAVDTSLAKIQEDLTTKGETSLAAQVSASRTALQTTVAQPTATLVQTVNQANTQSAKTATDATAAATQTAATSTQAATVNTNVTTELNKVKALSTTLQDQVTPASTELAADLAAAADKVPPVSDAQRQAFTEVLADPIRVERVQLNPVAHLGQGLAPYFLPVSLFLGALGIFLVMRPLSQRSLQFGANGTQATLNSWLPALAWGAAQVIALLLGMLILRLNAQAWLPLIAMLLLSAACFLALIQLLKAAFGGVGNYIALVLLVLQLVATGGVFPIEVSNAVFRALAPILPMTYSIDGIRRSIAGGPLSPYLWQDAAVLVGVTVVALALTALLANRRRHVSAEQLQPQVVLQ